ncbi:MAG: hypothetical protein H7Z37_05155 [Pyrinomonadaceae bacterium]|nr:hypothetical protein [Pyrinomonadaceae bacterium]
MQRNYEQLRGLQPAANPRFETRHNLRGGWMPEVCNISYRVASLLDAGIKETSDNHLFDGLKKDSTHFDIIKV